jgi:hypothetical protein
MGSKQKDLGQYMTPLSVAREMARQFQDAVTDCRVIDPACGDGNLLIAVVERLRAADGVRHYDWAHLASRTCCPQGWLVSQEKLGSNQRCQSNPIPIHKAKRTSAITFDNIIV